MQTRSVFYISDGTALTASALGASLLAQFEEVRFKEVRIPFLDSVEKAHFAVERINRQGERDGARPIVFSTLVDRELAQIVRTANALCLSYFDAFIKAMEKEMGVASVHLAGRLHDAEDIDYKHRIDAINYTLAHDDGISFENLNDADVILVAVSRCGKTPTSLYLAMQFSLKVANYPIVDQDFKRGNLPAEILKHPQKLFGLTISPERLSVLRTERKLSENYAHIDICRRDIYSAEDLMNAARIRFIDTSRQSIEEIATSIVHALHLG